jgi:dihydroorotate dehydrogenase electron transfer subunit
MLRSLQKLLKDHPIACQVSLEERMACGIGACLGRVVRARGDDGESKLVRVCTEGPVFDIRDVQFDNELSGDPGTEGDI